ncbi:MAG: NYN domain-containing protein, partial [Chloroflexota bacterium]|nr:NYN domain-containing protein [Chloroflexota bacterium]
MGEGALYFVDGNNVMGSRPDGWWRDRRGAARRLVEQVAELAQAGGGQWTVVFDSRAPKGDAALPPFEGVTVEYPERRGRNGADDHIIRLLEQLPSESEPVVFTSDRGLRERAESAGARIEGSRALLDRIAGLQPQGEGSVDARSGLFVRPATVDDVPLILAFIRGLAEYERLTHLVEATEEDVRETVFGESPRAEVL